MAFTRGRSPARAASWISAPSTWPATASATTVKPSRVSVFFTTVLPGILEAGRRVHAHPPGTIRIRAFRGIGRRHARSVITAVLDFSYDSRLATFPGAFHAASVAASARLWRFGKVLVMAQVGRLRAARAAPDGGYVRRDSRGRGARGARPWIRQSVAAADAGLPVAARQTIEEVLFTATWPARMFGSALR